MNTVPSKRLRESLEAQIHKECRFYSEILSKELFQRDLYRILSSYIQENQNNGLIQAAILSLDYGDLLPRMYLNLSILHGAHSMEPRVVEILKDFIGMLTEDLDEEELRVCAYARTKRAGFFLEEYWIWRKIRELYGSKDFDLGLLPPTPYYAFLLLSINRPKLILKNMSVTNLFDELSQLNHKSMKKYRHRVAMCQPEILLRNHR